MADDLFPVPFEAVSPRLETRKQWEDEIDAFWSAMRAVFHMPRRMLRCGSHVHVSPGRGSFHLTELQAIVCAVFFYDEQVQHVLPKGRRNHHYCVPNKRHSRYLSGKSMREVAALINAVQNKLELVKIVQGLTEGDRPMLWNFHNVTVMPFTTQPAIGTVEFRGGRCLRGPARTKRWISFAVAFIALAIQEVRRTYFEVRRGEALLLRIQSSNHLSRAPTSQLPPPNSGRKSGMPPRLRTWPSTCRKATRP